jgi:tRNA(adenine34) deaminase
MSFSPHYMDDALIEAGRALTAGDFPVGCVLVDAGGVVAAGHRINSGGVGNELDHAEMRALHHYVESRRPGEAMPFTVYCTMEPCLMCYSALVLHGADTIIYGYEDVMGGGCSLPPASLPPLFRKRLPRIIGGVRRADCLALFKQFFADHRNAYWQGSLLARYTLRQ